MSLRLARVSMFALLLSGAAVFFMAQLPEEAEGAGGALVTILPDTGNSALYAEVDPVRGGIVTFTGTLIIEQPVDLDAQYVTIDLVASIEGWEVTDIPRFTIAEIPGTVPFAVSAVVPQYQRTSGLDATRSMVIQGAWSYEPGLVSGSVEPVEVFIYIKQFYQIKVTCETPYLQTSPGGEFDIELELANQGNGDDEVVIDIEGRDTLEDNGWTFIFDEAKWIIPHGETKTVRFHVMTPKGWDAWTNEITVLHFRVSSVQASGANSISEVGEYSVFVRQRGVSVPGFEVPMTVGAVLLASILTLIRRKR